MTNSNNTGIPEKVADLVDRSQDPVAEQEFGRKLLQGYCLKCAGRSK